MNGGFLYLGLIKGFIVENGKETGSEYLELYITELLGNLYFRVKERRGAEEMYPVIRIFGNDTYVGKADKYYFKELP